MTTVTAAAIYVRISSDPNDNRRGVERQQAECEDLAEQLGWPVARVYEDNDASAMKSKPRPRFEELLADIEAGVVDGVLCWHADRLYRRSADLVRIIDTTKERPKRPAVPIRTVASGEVDLTTSSGRTVARLLGVMAEGEVEHAVERMKLAHRKRAETGEWRFNRRIFGYRWGGTEFEPAEAEAIRQAAVDVLSGVSTGEIARRWNKLGLRTTRNGNEWRSHTVVEVLKRPLAAGRVMYNGVDLGIEAQWEPLYDYATHLALVAFFDSRRVGKAKPRQWQGSTVYRCGVCRAIGVESGMEVSRRGQNYPTVYRCARKGHNSRNQAKVDNYVDALVIGRLSAPDAADLLDSGDGVDVPGLTAQRDGLLARIEKATSAWSADDGMEYADLLDAVKPLRAKVAEIDKQLAAQARRDPVAELLTAGGDMADRWAALSPDRRGKIIALLMTVTIVPTKPSRVFQPDGVEIEWKR